MTDTLQSLVDWLVEGAVDRRGLPDILAALCERLCVLGVPLQRAALFTTALHPQVMGIRFMWREGVGVQVFEAPFEMLASDDWIQNPVPYVVQTGTYVRRRLAAPGWPRDFKILEELGADGVTDYLAAPLTFLSGERHVVSWTTRAPNGFTSGHLAALNAVHAPLARLAEIHMQRRVATTLLDTYVGHRTGERILRGQIRLGHTEPIAAAIWLADLRGFTNLAETMPGSALISLVNDYFGCLVPPIETNGGEVLKFMGDGLLAIFPLVGEQTTAHVCATVLTAARGARANVAAMNQRLEKTRWSVLRFGLALHVGQVLYGNIGAANRLDFTAIGPSVNLAARLEKLAGDLGRDVVVSADFAQHCLEVLERVGDYELKGFRGRQAVYALPENAGGTS